MVVMRRPSVRRPATVLLFVANAACSSKQAQPGLYTTSSPSSTTKGPVASATTTPASAIPAGCPSGTGLAAQNAPQAARCLYEAWRRGDQVGAAAQPATGGQACTYGYHGQRYVFDVRRSEGGWRVTQVQGPS